jgi:hypothetical protein
MTTEEQIAHLKNRIADLENQFKWAQKELSEFKHERHKKNEERFKRFIKGRE